MGYLDMVWDLVFGAWDLLLGLVSKDKKTLPTERI